MYPPEADAEILGAGTVMAFSIISPLILLAYAIEGRAAIQRTSLDTVFCFIGAGCFIAAGGMEDLLILNNVWPVILGFAM